MPILQACRKTISPSSCSMCSLRRRAPGPAFVSTDARVALRASSGSRRRVWVQVKAPDQTNPGGVIAEGTFVVDRGNVVVRDLRGNFIGSQVLKNSDDPTTVARRVLRDQWSDFYDPLPIPKLSIV
jgi:hypothetical protein